MSFEGCRGTGHMTDLTDSGSGHTVWCHCPAAFCHAVGFFDSGRGDEHHRCSLRPEHDGDHAEGPVTWQDENGVAWPHRAGERITTERCAWPT